MLPELAWAVNLPYSFKYGIPSGLTHSLFDPPKDQLCASIGFGLSTPDLFRSRWDLVLQCAEKLGQYPCQDLAGFIRDAPNMPDPFMRIRIVSILLALMRKGIAPRFSGLLDWRGNTGLLGQGKVIDAFKDDRKLMDLIWLLGEQRIDECFGLCTSQLKNGTLLKRINADLWKSVGCVDLFDRKLHDSLIAAQKTLEKDSKRLAGMYSESCMKYERKVWLAERLSVRVCAGRLGAQAGQKRRWARGAQVYGWMTGETVNTSVFRRECLAGESVLSCYDGKNPTSGVA